MHAHRDTGARVRRRKLWVGGIAAIICIACGVMLYFAYYDGVAAAEDAASRTFAIAANRAEEQVQGLFDQAVVLSRIGSSIKGIDEPVLGDGTHHPAIDFLTAAVGSAPSFYATYYGFADGSFLEVIAARGDPTIVAGLGAPAGTTLVIRSVVNAEDGSKTQNWTYLDAAGATLAKKVEADPAYDPRKTDWYLRARAEGVPTLTQPYFYSSIPVLGITMVQKLAANRGVFGVDLTLSGLSRIVAEQPISAHGGVYLFDDLLRLVAARPDGPNGVPADKLLTDMRTLRLPVLQALAEMPRSSSNDRIRIVRAQSTAIAAYVSRWQSPEGGGINVGIAAPLSDFTDRIEPALARALLVTAAILAAAIPLAAWSLRRRLDR